MALPGANAFAAPKTLVFCAEVAPRYLNPQLATDNASFDVSQQIFERLTAFKPGTTEVIPALAQSWQLSADGKSYLLQLRQGVQFHSNRDFQPSRPFNADDVLFSFNRQRERNHPYHAISGGSYPYFAAMELDKLIEKIEKIDDYQLKITLTRANAPFLANLAMDFLSIHSAEYSDVMRKAGTPEKVDTHPIGTGAFALVDAGKDRLRYQAFADYWQGKTPLDRLVFAITPDAAVRYAKLVKGECPAMENPHLTDLAAMRQQPSIRVLEQTGLDVRYLSFNTQKPPFDNVKVRQALTLATNKQAILAAVYLGAGSVAHSPLPPNSWAYQPDPQDRYDPEQAKMLLADASFAQGFDTEIWVSSPNTKRTAELLQADWAAIGVQANIVMMDWAEYQKRAAQGDVPLGLSGWSSDNGDPDNFLSPLLSCAAIAQGSNYARWCNAEFDALLAQAAQISGQNDRTLYYQQAQHILQQQAPWIVLIHSHLYEPIRTEVKNYHADPFKTHRFYGVDLDAR